MGKRESEKKNGERQMSQKQRVTKSEKWSVKKGIE
jgi:hypothetical protein